MLVDIANIILLAIVILLTIWLAIVTKRLYKDHVNISNLYDWSEKVYDWQRKISSHNELSYNWQKIIFNRLEMLKLEKKNRKGANKQRSTK